MDKRNDINKFRKKRAMRKFWLNMGILTLIVLVIISAFVKLHNHYLSVRSE